MRIALLSYRSKTHCGGQGVYVRHLTRGLVELGHDVEVFSGQPYPDGARPAGAADQGAQPRPVPRTRSVPDPVARARSRPASTCSNCSRRGRPASRSRRRSACAWRGCWPSAVTTSTSCTTTRASAPGCWTIAELGLPVVATVHHPITRDRVLDVAAAQVVAKAAGAPVVRLRRDAEAGRPPDPRTADRVVDVGGRHRRGLRRCRPTSCTSCRSASTPNCSSPPSTGCAIASSRSPAPTCRSRASATCCTPLRGCASNATSSCSWSRSSNPTDPPRS